MPGCGVRGCGLRAVVVLCVTLALGLVSNAGAQVLPESPISLANGHIILGGDVTATIAPDDPGFFNYTSYEFSALRNVRIGVTAEIRANDRLQLLGEVRLDQGRVLETYGLYLRLRPFASRRLDIQAGRIPPTFGALTRSAYGNGNLLIGQPLAYQYLTSIRADALPSTADELLRMRGRGWLSSFPVGNAAPGPGLPIVNTSEWDTGLQLHGVVGMLDWTGAITAGSLSDPRLRDNNSGRQFAGRAVVRPVASTAIGVSAARGAWLNGPMEDEVAGESAGRSQQTALGGDMEYSSGRVLVRGEVIRSAWRLPAFGRLEFDEPIVAISSLIEARYKILPGLYVAIRGDRLDFSAIRGTAGPAEWDAQTWRVETGLGYSVTRNITVKMSWQKNHRDGGRIRKDALVAGQVLYWF